MIDFCNTTDAPYLEHDVDLVIQEIDMLFDTDEGEVLGDTGYGSDFEKFIWELKVSAEYINGYVTSRISSSIDLHGFALSVDTSIYEGTQNDIILIRINLSKDGSVWEKIYNIS